MKLKKLLLLFLFFSSIIFSQSKEIVAYFPEWGVEHQPYFVKHIEEAGSAGKITVINYAFSEPKPDSSGNIVADFMNPYYAYEQIYTSEMSLDGIADDSTQPLRGHFNQLKKLKKKYPDLKIVMSLGGWLGSVYFSEAALTPESRENFVNSCIDQFIHGNLPVENNAGGKGVAKGIFNGIDIDWEYPVEGGVEGIKHNENDTENLSKLFALFRKKLDEINTELLLTAAVPAKKSILKFYNINQDQKYLDWYLLMTYDFRGGWDRLTGHHTNLYSSDYDLSDDGIKESFDNSVKFFRDSLGVSSKKIIPGAAFYGRGWRIMEIDNDGLYKKGIPAPGLYETGFNYFRDLNNLYPRKNKYAWDKYSMAPYIFNEDDSLFWTLDDVQSVVLKSKYVDAYNLRGLMFWEISGDDSLGTLVNSIYSRSMPDKLNFSQDPSNAFPSVSLMNPDSAVKAGSDLILNTEITGSIVKVEFFANGRSLGYDTTFPYNWVWFNIPKGIHKIEAVAIDLSKNKVNHLIEVNIN